MLLLKDGGGYTFQLAFMHFLEVLTKILNCSNMVRSKGRAWAALALLFCYYFFLFSSRDLAGFFFVSQRYALRDFVTCLLIVLE